MEQTETVEQQIAQFKVRCSSISEALSSSRDNPCLTDKQADELIELEKKADKNGTLTKAQTDRLAELKVKQENGKKVILSDTYIKYLKREYAWLTRGMVSVTRELLDIPQMSKGTIVEPESVLLVSKVTGKLYKANVNENGERERIYNEFLSGEVDSFVGEQIMGAEEINDMKSVWDWIQFLYCLDEPITADNDWQVKGYLDISGAPVGSISKCLIDTPDFIIQGQKWKLLNKLNVASEDAAEFKEKWAIIERSMYFSHIPQEQRVFKQPVERMTAEQQTKVYDRVKVGREWLNNFHERYSKLNKRIEPTTSTS